MDDELFENVADDFGKDLKGIYLVDLGWFKGIKIVEKDGKERDFADSYGG